jgi:Carboxylesterase family
LPPSEYNALDSEKKSKWNPLAFRTFSIQTLRHSRKFWISIGIAIMVLLTVLLTTVLVLTQHAQKAHANIDFTVDLGYSKYVGTAAADNKIVKWLGIRYAAPPVGNNRFRAPQDPVVDGKTIQANTVCLASSL